MSRRHPEWFKIKLPRNRDFYRVNSRLKKEKLHTVCTEARCPNRAACYSEKRVTFLILGDVCTRNCLYCGVSSGTPGPPDPREPEKIADILAFLQCRYCVITSVTRDDLADHGADHFVAVLKKIKTNLPECKIEVLVPDFSGRMELVQKITAAKPYVFSHNIELVKPLFSHLRPGGNYEQSLEVLKMAKKEGCFTKSGIMVGCGETINQVCDTFVDLRKAKVDAITIGQYLPPGKNNFSVKKYYTPNEFEDIRIRALDMGFQYAFSGPLVRSSSAEIRYCQ